MIRNMVNWLLGTACLGLCILATGCCGPIGCGVGCGLPGDSCSDCSGGYSATPPIPYGPFDALRQWKRSLVCGGGCGEVYYGEWMSTPPDANDPCCGSQFVGGATKCAPFCWQPGALFGNLYGRRYSDGSELMGGCGDTGCGGYGCDSCGGEIIGETGGCATCDASTAFAGTRRVAQQQPQRQPQMRAKAPMTKQQMMAQQQMQRTAQRMQGSQPRNTTGRQSHR